MSQVEDTKILISARINQAQDSLNEGMLLLQGGYYKGAVNRFYYSMFYAVLALLITRQSGTSKHAGAISLFDREFVKPGIFSKEMSVWLHKTFELRLEVDYADLIEVSPEKVQECSQQAVDFVQQVRIFLDSYLAQQ